MYVCIYRIFFSNNLTSRCFYFRCYLCKSFAVLLCFFQTWSTLGPFYRPGFLYFPLGGVRNVTVSVSPAACCAPGVCLNATAWTAARGTAVGPWFVRGRGAAGCWQGSSPGVMAVVTLPFLECTHELAGSYDGLTRLSTNLTNTDNGETWRDKTPGLMGDGKRRWTTRYCFCIMPSWDFMHLSHLSCQLRKQWDWTPTVSNNGKFP